MSKPLNLDGQKFGEWLVLSTEIKLHGKTKPRTASFCTCKCTCGIIKEICAYDLKRGKSKMCRSCATRKQNTNHKNNTKHNKSYTVEYKTWSDMKRRCYNEKIKNFSDYGGRGIKVCDRWLESFENFYEDMGKRPSIEFSIDRIDVNKDYSPENCRWADQKTQMRNRRNTKIVNYKGVEKPLAQFCEELNLELSTITNRIKIGWSVEKAFTTPIKYIKK